jgi:hypothetical protein
MPTPPKPTLLILTGLLVLAGCARPQDRAPAGGDTVAAGSPAATSSTDSARPRVGPGEAAAGTPYPFDLYVHCGGQYTRFADRVWKADNPPGNLLPRPGADGTTKVTGYVPGTMTLVSADRADFVVDAGSVVHPPAGPVVFRAVDEPLPLCK